MLALNEPEVKAADLKKIYHGCLWAEPSEIIDNPYNPRDLSDTVEIKRLRELAKSISEYGLWQYPLATRINGYDGMVILAGHRRVCAIRNYLNWPIIPYHPSEWHGLPESFDIRDAMYVLVMDQELNKTHSATQKAKIAHDMHNKNIAPIGMPAAWELRRQVWEFLENYPEIAALVTSRSGRGSGNKATPENGKRVVLGWSIVSGAINSCRGFDDIAIKHLWKYINLEYPTIREMRTAVRMEASERLKELA